MGGTTRRGRRRTGSRRLATLATVTAVALPASLAPSGPAAAGAARAATATTSATVGAAPQRTIPPGFLGLSIEYSTLAADEGSDPSAPDPVFEQLIRNLTPGASPVLRIGGDSTDHTWWPVPGMRRPPGVSYTLTPTWLDTTAALANALSARLILGIDLEADSERLAATEADRLVGGFGRSRIAGLEIGNEPELYGSFGWYRSRGGLRVLGRPGGYTAAQFTAQFAQFAGALPGVPIAGPSSGSILWGLGLPQFAAAEPRLRMLTVHVYPLKSCGAKPGSPAYPTISELLSPSASEGMAQSIAGDVLVAHETGLPIRVDEINSVSCGGAAGVSDTFASSLWALNTMFAIADAGFDGVNVHTRDNSVSDRLFSIQRRGDRWTAAVKPEYYGLLMFAIAAPPGSQLLPVSQASGAPLTVWATRGAGGVVRVTAVNTSSHPVTTTLDLPSATAIGVVEQLIAPSASARTGVTLGGASFGASTATGALAATPRCTRVAPSRGGYTVTVRGPGASLLLVPSGPSAHESWCPLVAP